MNRRMGLWALALGLLGTAFVQAQEVKTDAPAVIRIGVATGGVGNPIRHGGTSTALAYADKAIEEEFRKDGTKGDMPCFVWRFDVFDTYGAEHIQRSQGQPMTMKSVYANVGCKLVPISAT